MDPAGGPLVAWSESQARTETRLWQINAMGDASISAACPFWVHVARPGGSTGRDNEGEENSSYCFLLVEAGAGCALSPWATVHTHSPVIHHQVPPSRRPTGGYPSGLGVAHDVT